MREGPCRRETLARTLLCRVDACTCGILHIHLGPFTLRLEPRACEEIAGTLLRALACLEVRSARIRQQE